MSVQDPRGSPLDPEIARDIAQDAFLTGLVFDGKDLRNMRRWTRNTPGRAGPNPLRRPVRS